MATYRTSFHLVGSVSASERVSFENPSASGKKVFMHMALRTIADQGFATWKIRRRDQLADHASPQTATIQKNDSADPASVCSVFYDTDGTQLSFQGSVTWERLTSHDASDGGDDNEDYPAKNLLTGNAFVIRPGESMTLVLPDGEIDWNIEMIWEEVSL